MISKLSLLICFCICTILPAQDLESGFAMLESKDYAQAVELFSEILVSDPGHKTARICHARALGLGGSTIEAHNLFKELNSDFPSDTEVELNLAESLLWNKEFNQAIDVYAQVLSLIHI